MSHSTISIIIPVYRAMPFLAQCLESLLSQTIIDQMEIVCIDDCGGDGSVDYIRNLQNSHPRGSRVVLYSLDANRGASAARNFGVTKAEGEYIGFVDADDWCEPEMYQLLLDGARQYDAQWAYCLGQKEYADGTSFVLNQPAVASGSMQRSDRQILLTQGVAYFWTGLYSRQFLINGSISFPEGKFSEDSYFWYTVLMHSDSLAFVDKVGYHYRIQENSVSRRPDPTKAEQKQQMYSKLLSRFRGEGLYADSASELDYLYIKKGLLIPLIIKAINHPDTTTAYYRQMIAQAADDKVEIKHNAYFRHSLPYRILLAAFRFNGRLISRLLRLKYRTDPF